MAIARASLITRIESRGFTVTTEGIPCALHVEPDADLTDAQRAQLAANRDDILCDLLFPPCDASDSLAAFHRLNAGGELY